MTKSERVPAATMLLLLIAAWAPYALGFGTAPMGLSRSALGSSRSALVTRVGDGSRRIPAIFGGSRDALARRTGGLFRQPESSGLKLRMTLGDEESRDTTSLNDLAANKAMQLLLSRRHMIGASAAAAAAASISRPTSASAAAAAQADESTDVFGEGVLKAPGKLVKGAEVEKSPSDKRSYRALTLPNGLRVLLASDPNTNKAAAALDVHVGHFSDPDNIPGMAHFCEHMLFLGTEKYPTEGALEKFLSVHGGSSNAYTDTEDTNYFFDVNEDSLEGALDIFSQFFVSPLFTASGVERELNAIESEHSKNLQTDSWRINQVGKTRGNQAHPYAKFGTGNKYTLKENTAAEGINLREKLLEFHDKYYSANQMTLAVCGKEDLDTLQKMVVSRFSSVPNTNRPTPEVAWQGKILPFDSEAYKTIYNVVPVADSKDIYLAWIMPFTSAEDRLAKTVGKPQFPVSSVIGYEGKGSLLSYLKDKKGWITSLGAAEFDNMRDFDIYGLAISLTKEGFKHREEIVETIFAYINKMKKEGIPDYINKDLMELNGIYWKFQERVESQQFCTSTAANMHRFQDPKLYISGTQRVRNLDPKEVTKYLNKLKPETCLVTYINKGAKVDRKEKWYGTEYSMEPVGDRLSAWINPKDVPDLRIPPPNPFIPKDFSIKSKITETGKDVSGPKVVLDNDRWKLHFKADNRYGKPKAYAFFQFTQSDDFFGTSTTPRTSALAKLYKASISDALNEYSYDASAAGLNYQVTFTTKGPEISFSGYNDKLQDFVKYVAGAVASHMPSDEARFQRYKDSITEDLSNFINDQPYRHAVLFSRLYTDSPSYTPIQVLDELKGLTLAELQDFTRKIFKEFYAEALVQGNLGQEEALGMVEAMDNAFKFATVPKEKRAYPRATKLPQAADSLYGTVLSMKEPNPNNPNSAVVVQIQSSNKETKHQMAWEVLASMLEQPFYGSLRTKQQLGYIVGAGIKAAEGARSLTFTVQSSVADSSYATQKVFEFLEESFTPIVENMSEKDFKIYVDGIVREKLQQEKKLVTEVTRHWGEIQGEEYIYDRAQREAAALLQVKKEDVVAIYKDCVLPKGSQRRVFVSGIESQVPNPQRLKGAEFDKAILAQDPKKFQATNGLLERKSIAASNILAYKPIYEI